jgi:hypothetical protein
MSINFQLSFRREEAKKQKTKKKKTSVSTLPATSIINPSGISPPILSFEEFQRGFFNYVNVVTPLDKEKK